MTTQAQYNAAGQITSTIWPTAITDEAQIAALAAQGISLLIIPDGKNANTGMIVNGVYQDFPPAPAPIPNVAVQTAAALINAGLIDSSAYHPTTIMEMNDALAAVNMATIPSTLNVGLASKQGG